MPPTDIAVSVRGLSKSYTIASNDANHTTAAEAIVDRLRNPRGRPQKETFWALKGIDFDIHQGDVLGIIGRNGAGKSTLLKILSRVTEPTTGRIDLYGRVGSLLEVGTGFHPELTGRENVFLNGAILGMSKREISRHFDEIVAFAEVDRFLDTPVKRYSSGMYVRLAFAVAAHLDPEILIVDEVLAVGDASFQKKCLGKMQEVSRQAGRTVIFVSHNVATMRNLCSSVLWLKSGQIHKAGEAHDVIGSYMEEAFDPSVSLVNLNDIPRPHGLGDQLRFHELAFNDGHSLCHGEKLSVCLKYQAKETFEDVLFGAGFSTLDGVRLMTLESNTGGNDFTIHKGTGAAEFSMDRLWLQPGHYTFDVGVGSGSMALDYLRGCANIDVLPGRDTPSTLYNQPREGVSPPATWRLRGWESSDWYDPTANPNAGPRVGYGR